MAVAEQLSRKPCPLGRTNKRELEEEPRKERQKRQIPKTTQTGA